MKATSTPSSPPKVCLLCKHIYYSTGSYGYSEYTPGYEASISCSLGHWYWDQYEDDDGAFRKKMLTAETCPDYEFYKESDDG